MENPKDETLFRIIKIICEHIIPINKAIYKKHMELLAVIQPASRETVVDAMLKFSIINEEKISAQLEGKKGSLVHGGWSRNGTHFVTLIDY